MKIFLQVLALAALATLASADCNNPLGEAQMIDLESTAASRDGVCAEDVLGGESCCSQEYHDNLEDLILELYTKYETSSSYLVAMVQVMDEVLDKIYEHTEDLLADLDVDVDAPTREDSDVDPELGVITSGEWRELVAAWPTTMQTCHQKLFDLGSAFMCLACDSEWESYMETYKIYLDDGNCDEIIDDCGDLDEVTYYWGLKFVYAYLYIWSMELLFSEEDSYTFSDLSFNFDIGTDYYDADYDTADDFEEADLEFYATSMTNCDFSSVMGFSSTSQITEHMGIFGLSIHNVMLQPNTYYLAIEEMIAWGNGESNAFEERRMLVRDMEGVEPKRRQLRESERFVISFGSSTDYKDAFEISTAMGYSPVVAELFSGTIAFSFFAVMLTFIANLL